jgi:hypothetical protein
VLAVRSLLEHLQGRWNRGGFRNGHEL